MSNGWPANDQSTSGQRRHGHSHSAYVERPTATSHSRTLANMLCSNSNSTVSNGLATNSDISQVSPTQHGIYVPHLNAQPLAVPFHNMHPSPRTSQPAEMSNWVSTYNDMVAKGELPSMHPSTPVISQSSIMPNGAAHLYSSPSSFNNYVSQSAVAQYWIPFHQQQLFQSAGSILQNSVQGCVPHSNVYHHYASLPLRSPPVSYHQQHATAASGIAFTQLQPQSVYHALGHASRSQHLADECVAGLSGYPLGGRPSSALPQNLPKYQNNVNTAAIGRRMNLNIARDRSAPSFQHTSATVTAPPSPHANDPARMTMNLLRGGACNQRNKAMSPSVGIRTVSCQQNLYETNQVHPALFAAAKKTLLESEGAMASCDKPSKAHSRGDESTERKSHEAPATASVPQTSVFALRTGETSTRKRMSARGHTKTTARKRESHDTEGDARTGQASKRARNHYTSPVKQHPARHEGLLTPPPIRANADVEEGVATTCHEQANSQNHEALYTTLVDYFIRAACERAKKENMDFSSLLSEDAQVEMPDHVGDDAAECHACKFLDLKSMQVLQTIHDHSMTKDQTM